MEGPEVSVETLTVDGICHVIQITDKLTTGAPHFVELAHHQPSTLTTEIKDSLYSITKNALDALGKEIVSSFPRTIGLGETTGVVALAIFGKFSEYACSFDENLE